MSKARKEARALSWNLEPLLGRGIEAEKRRTDGLGLLAPAGLGLKIYIVKNFLKLHISSSVVICHFELLYRQIY